MKDLKPIRILMMCLMACALCWPLTAEDFVTLKKKAADGDVEAQYQLAEVSFWGQGTPIDHNATLKWAGKAAEQEHALAMHRLAVMYMLGQGVEQDVLSGIQLMESAVPGLRKLAATNNADAQFKLGLVLLYGTGSNIDSNAALELISAAAKAGNPMAQFVFGDLILRDNRKEPDLKATRAWFLKAAQQGLPRAQLKLAAMMLEGVGGPRDEVGAATWLRKAADQGHANAQYFYGQILGEGKGVPRNAKTSIEWIRKSALQGFPSALFKLGQIYHRGIGVKQDPKEAYFWYSLAVRQGNELAAQLRSEVIRKITNSSDIPAARKRAASFRTQPTETTRRSHLGIPGGGELMLITIMVDGQKLKAKAGDLDAMDRLCGWYIDGLKINGRVAVEKSPRKSLELARKLAEADHVSGYWYMGVFYTYGLKAALREPDKNHEILIKPDPAKRFEWLLKAAEKGKAEAQLAIGQCFEGATGTKLDYKKSMHWYRKAFDQGDRRGAHAISMMYRTGRGKEISKDLEKWEYWLRKSADLGFAMAQNDLGVALYSGKDIKKDQKEARVWMLRAARQGMAKAQHGIAVMLTDGDGGPQDPLQAFKWSFLAATRAKYRDAEIMLNVIVKKITPAQQREAIALARAFVPRPERPSVLKSLGKADVKQLTAEANKGKAVAQYDLGRLYAIGVDVEADRVQAYKWLYLADQQGHPNAGQACLDVLKKMSSAEKRAGLKAVLAFKPAGAPK